jgi:hypothetical protein
MHVDFLKKIKKKRDEGYPAALQLRVIFLDQRPYTLTKCADDRLSLESIQPSHPLKIPASNIILQS